MKIGTNLGVADFKKNYEEIIDYTDFLELFYGKTQDITDVKPYRESIKTIHLPDLDNQIFQALDTAHEVTAEKAVVHFYTFTKIPFKEKIDTLKRLSWKAEDYGIQLCLENTAENVGLMKILFEHLPEYAFCLDIGHANLFSNHPIDFIEAFGSRLHHIHIHDNHGGYSHDSDLHLAPGEGNIYFSRIFQLLNGINYSEYITFESTPWDSNQRIINTLINIRKMIQKYI